MAFNRCELSSGSSAVGTDIEKMLNLGAGVETGVQYFGKHYQADSAGSGNYQATFWGYNTRDYGWNFKKGWFKFSRSAAVYCQTGSWGTNDWIACSNEGSTNLANSGGKWMYFEDGFYLSGSMYWSYHITDKVDIDIWYIPNDGSIIPEI